jgi:imidazolonepropionase-like amidohydrolase
MKRLLAICVVCLITQALVPGQATRPLVITGATVITGTDRAPIKDGVILIEGDRIRQVGARGQVEIPAGADVLDASGKFIIPGLGDMHNHLGAGRFGFGEGAPDYSKNLTHLLGWGFTMTFNPGITDMAAFAELKRMSAEPRAPFPHFFSVGKQFGAKGGHGSLGGYAPETAEQARAAVRENKAANVDAIKLVYSPVTYALKSGLPQLKPDVMAAIIDEAHEQGLRAYVHAPVLRFAKEALKAGADGLVHGIISDPIDEKFIELMKKNRAAYVTTHTIFEAAGDVAGWARRLIAYDQRRMVPKAELEKGAHPDFVTKWETRWDNYTYMRSRLPILRANTRKAYEAGLLVVVGSDTGDAGAGLFNGLAAQVELQLLVEAGLSPTQVLKAATLNAARMIGREKDLGSIESGKLADLLILNGDPLSDIRNTSNIYRVVKGGIAYDPVKLLRLPE